MLQAFETPALVARSEFGTPAALRPFQRVPANSTSWKYLAPGGENTMDRPAKLNLMRDILDHLRTCYEQWSMADVYSEHYLAESMKRDLDELRRVCDSMRGGTLRNVKAA